MSKIENKYKKLDDISHVLLRPGMYISSIKPHESSKFIYKDGEMVLEDTSFIPGFLKIFDEIIMNSVDEHKREGSKLNKIKVNIDGDYISVWDNGGIEVVKHKVHDEWIPEMIFSNLKAGSNFNDTDNRTGSGTNGVGSSLANIFSKEFIISTCDGENAFKQIFKNNMRDRNKPSIRKSTRNHTEIKYLPDYERFGMSGMDETHFKLIQKRVVDIAGCNPTIKIYFNGDEIKVKSFEDYVKIYEDEYNFESNEDKSWSLAVSPSNGGFKQISFVNSTETYDGGTHIKYILDQIVVELRAYFNKKHKYDIKPSEIKNHISIYLNSTVINPMFSSQTKEKLITEQKDFGYEFEVSKKMIRWILKSEIVHSILDWIDRKKESDAKKLTRNFNKTLSKVKVNKLIDAKGKDRESCSLSIFEGDSASSAFRKYRDPKTQGGFSLRGKFTNVTGVKTNKLIQNKEVLNLMASIGLKFGEKADVENLRYAKILFYCDADHDGSSIVGLLINFLYRFWPELFENSVVFKAETPIVVCKNLKTKKKTPFYTQEEYNKWLVGIKPKEWEIDYKKGLAALVDDEYSQIIKNPKLVELKSDGDSEKTLNVWFGNKSDLRKKEMIDE